MADATTESGRQCPECGETIKAQAKKCRYCGTFFDASLQKERRNRGRKAIKPRPDMREVASSLLILVGMPSFVFVCMGAHMCMAGHWHHAPYPTWHYASEFLWVSAFVAAGVVTAMSTTARRWVRPLLLFTLVVSRLILGGHLMPVELLFALILVVAAIVSLVRRAVMSPAPATA